MRGFHIQVVTKNYSQDDTDEKLFTAFYIMMWASSFPPPYPWEGKRKMFLNLKVGRIVQWK